MNWAPSNRKTVLPGLLTGPTVYTDKLATVTPTLPAATPTPEPAPVAATAPLAVAARPGRWPPPPTASAAIASLKLIKQRLTLSGTRTACASSVTVTVARVSGARKSEAIRATLKSAKWTAAASLAKGKYRVTVKASSMLGAKAGTATTKTFTVK